MKQIKICSFYLIHVGILSLFLFLSTPCITKFSTRNEQIDLITYVPFTLILFSKIERKWSKLRIQRSKQSDEGQTVPNDCETSANNKKDNNFENEKNKDKDCQQLLDSACTNEKPKDLVIAQGCLSSKEKENEKLPERTVSTMSTSAKDMLDLDATISLVSALFGPDEGNSKNDSDSKKDDDYDATKSDENLQELHFSRTNIKKQISQMIKKS